MAKKKRDNINFNLYEQAVFNIREKPEYADLVKWAYFDKDVKEAATRFSQSFEAAQIIWLIDYLLGLKDHKKRCNFHIADIGGGRGIVSYALSTAGYRVTLFDVDKSVVCGTGAAEELIRRSKADIKIITADIEHYNKEVGNYDIVFCKQVLHHANDLNRMVVKMANLIKNNGYLFAFKEHVVRTKKDLPVFLKNHPLNKFNTYENAFPRSVYIESFRKAGLKNIQSWIAGCTPVPREFLSVINGENVRIPPKGHIASLKRMIRFYFPFPGAEFSFIAKKPVAKAKL